MDEKCHKSYLSTILSELKKHLNSMKITKIYDEDSNIGCFTESDVQYHESSQRSQWFTLFTWKNENWKNWKVVANLHDKEQYVIHICKKCIESLNSIKKLA